VSAPEVLDPIRRLYVMAGVLPGAVVREEVVDATPESVWGVVTDWEQGIAEVEPFIAAARIEHQEGDLVHLKIRSPLGVSVRNTVRVGPDWWWIESPFFVAGMAVRREGERTRIAHLEGTRRVPLLGRLMKPFLYRKMRGELLRAGALARRRAGD
jgi:hypothetical protein